MSGPISKLYAEEGQVWLRVNHGHSVSEHWLRDNAPDLYAEWWAAPSAAAQDQVALRIEQRLDDVEGPDVSTAAVNRMVEKVAEAGSWELMARHQQTSAQESARDSALRAQICAEMSPEDPHAALRAEVLLAIAESGYDLRLVRARFRERGVDLSLAPALLPVSEFYERHRAAIEARLDREISDGMHRDLVGYMASWRHNRPSSASLHDIERAIVEDIVGGIVDEVEGAGHRELREAERMYERSQDRVLIREWSDALDRDEVHLTEQVPLDSRADELDYNARFDMDADIGIDQELP